ncbi:MAG: aspartyl/asparaginyl beta-hydroxylase domain-containing protein [Cellvibrio sp.]|uniref:aspartyl/asparaginyl beta-hydroxylase domain-containing protein n=1 Tax=Cellvibrio sp. TaxID=1965322 RepID=UPI00319F1674
MENPVAPSAFSNSSDSLEAPIAIGTSISSSSFSPVISFAKIGCVIQLAALQAEVDLLLTNPWIDHVNKQDYRGGWDVLPLRCQRQHLHAHPILQGFAIADGDDWENLPVMLQCKEIQRLFNQLQCPIKAARLMRLKAGAEIKPHRDHELSLEFGEARLHVPIHTSDTVSFIVDNKLIPMRAGELWYFNADQTHEVYNRSNEDRINLVIDCTVNDWLREKILSGAVHE